VIDEMGSEFLPLLQLLDTIHLVQDGSLLGSVHLFKGPVNFGHG
jgi:hypothetical protein